MGTYPISRNQTIYVAGHRGMVGSAVWRLLARRGYAHIVGATSTELDLRDALGVEHFFQVHQPAVVVVAAARVGGILANSEYPAQFLGDNLRIQTNILEAAQRHGTQRLLFLGSSCIYPRHSPQPIPESALLTGPLEPTNSGYAIAKISGILHVQAMRKQYGVRWISAMPTNLYGPGDFFDLQKSHVLPAMIRKFHEAKVVGASEVVLWGTGRPRREFLHVDDLAEACLFLLEHYDNDEHINVGTGEDNSIAELAGLVKRIVGFTGEVTWDETKPDGMPRKLLDVSSLRDMGWSPQISLEQGLRTTYQWFQKNLDSLRV